MRITNNLNILGEVPFGSTNGRYFLRSTDRQTTGVHRQRQVLRTQFSGFLHFSVSNVKSVPGGKVRMSKVTSKQFLCSRMHSRVPKYWKTRIKVRSKTRPKTGPGRHPNRGKHRYTRKSSFKRASKRGSKMELENGTKNDGQIDVQSDT
jgi:hypothetical protein